MCLRRSCVSLKIHKTEPTLQGLSCWIFAHVAATPPTAVLNVSRLRLFYSVFLVLQERLQKASGISSLALTTATGEERAHVVLFLLILWSYFSITVSRSYCLLEKWILSLLVIFAQADGAQSCARLSFQQLPMLKAHLLKH